MDEEIRILNDNIKQQIDKMELYKQHLLIKLIRMPIQHRIKRYYLKEIELWHAKMSKQIQEHYNNLLQEIYNKYKLEPSAETQEEQQPPQQPSAVNINKKACLIGINYTNTSNELYGCVNDVMNLKTMLETKYKYNPENIRTIINEQATRNTILREFALLLKNATSGDILFFSYSGHGTYTIDRSGEEIDGKDELLVSVDNYAIFDDELKQIIDIYLKPNVKLFTLFDNCHSGTILDLPYQYFKTTTQSPIEPIIHPKCRETQGEVICLSGCRDDQVSMDAYINNTYAGAMTRTFIDVLTNVDMNNSLLGQGLSWNVFINEIRTMLRLRNFQQIPQLTCGNKIDFTVKPVVF